MKILKESGFSAEKIVENGNKFLIGNGYLGYRGTLDEFGAKECVGLNIAGLYDGVAGKWRETVNAFNPFYCLICADGAPLDVRGENIFSHEIALDMEKGTFFRETVFSVGGGRVTLFSERFISAVEKDLLCSRLRLTSEKNISLHITAGIDADIWDLNGPHLCEVETHCGGTFAEASGKTQELGIPVRVVCTFSHPLKRVRGGMGEISINLKAGESFVLDRVARVLVGEEGFSETDFLTAQEAHRREWARLWSLARLDAKGDARAQFALDYSVYHLLILAPKGNYSIAARGLSGQTYKGAVFWDTEIFLLPFYMDVLPQCAKRLVEYRVNTLPAAREKAKSYGFGGAFYAWESQNGYDACSDFNVTDVFTHRPVRTYFKEKQIHISADVAYAILKYYGRTQDDEFMLRGGLETVLSCAEFARTYSYYNHVKKRYELLDVIGPDEYHERVNNNAYTNYMFYLTAKEGVALAEKFLKKYPACGEKLLENLPAKILEKLKEWTEKLYLPQPNGEGIIEQFDGYFRLEDVGVEEVRSRLCHPNEYWGGSGGVATATRVIKQADVIMLFNLYPDLFSEEIRRANYDFYLPYTEHGSSLSRCSYAIAACNIGRREEAYSAFLESAEIDLRGGGKQWAGEVYIGGTHPAASGGAWIAAFYGLGFGKKEDLQ